MNTPAEDPKPNFDDEFLQEMAKWREQHKLREDDAVMLLVELFRLHQRHWDTLRRKEFPPLDQFHDDVAQLAITIKTLPTENVPVTTAIMSVIAGLLGGFLIGRAFH